MYADDNRDNAVPNPGSPTSPASFPPNYSSPPPPNGTGDTPAWVWGNMNPPTGTDATNIALIKYGLLFPYTKNVALYKCPGNQTPMLRGISMNCYMGNNGYANGYSFGPFQTYTKTTAITHPSQIYICIDEYQETINDGMFLAEGQTLGFNMKMNDWPAEYHGGSSGLSFADGHAELHYWRYLGLPGPNYAPGQNGGNSINGSAAKDVQALVQMSTFPSSGSW
jgi:prepilin-type processing-associated H-X9-DG protein